MQAQPELAGHLVENFVWAELLKQATWSSLQVELYHFRTTSNKEVDLVIEDRKGRVVGIEIKQSNTVWPEDFRGLKFLKQELGDRFVRGVVLYLGDKIVPHSEKLTALPLSALWEYSSMQ